MKIFMVFGSDLVRAGLSPTEIGPDTKKACELAVHLCKHAGNSSSIVATAGAPPKEKWGDVWMAHLMVGYMHTLDRSLKYNVEKASTFDTFGEAQALASAMPMLVARQHLRKLDTLVLVAKEWHAPRARMDCVFWLGRCGVDVDVALETYESPASFWTRVIRERMATARDRYRMAQARSHSL